MIARAGLTGEDVCKFLWLLENANDLQLGVMKRTIEEVQKKRGVKP